MQRDTSRSTYPSKLTPESIAAATIEPGKTSRKLAAGGGLYLLLQQRGRPSWRYKYRVGGRESSVSLGSYAPGAVDHVSIEDAIAAAIKCRAQVKDGKNPADVRRNARTAEYVAANNTFEKIGSEYLKHDDTRAPRTVAKHEWLYGPLAPRYTRAPLPRSRRPTCSRCCAD